MYYKVLFLKIFKDHKRFILKQEKFNWKRNTFIDSVSNVIKLISLSLRAQKLMEDDLKVVWAKFSTLS